MSRDPDENVKEEIALPESRNLLLRLRRQTDGYRVAPKACTTRRVIKHKLKEIDNGLTQPLNIENTVPFPKVPALNRALLN